ncbi:MAG: IS4 family transposase [Hyphomicrobiales bacterium]|nr:IS4 family transposase [Hyphomicrobiales bacterium]
MRHQNSVFHEITKHIPWAKFERLVDQHGSDFRVRRLTSKSQFLALLFGQLSGAASLREIEAGLASHASQLYHLGATQAPRSTLSDANAKRPWGLFADLFAEMAASASRRTRRQLADVTHILDATQLKLSSLHQDWAVLRNRTWAAKLHVVYDPDADTPLKLQVTPQNVNDITPAKAFTPEPGVTYVFDLAYYDYRWWADLDALGCRIVTRLKCNTRLTVSAELPVPEGTNVLADRIGHLPQRQASSRRNPFSDPVREIVVRLTTGKQIRVLTNDLDAPAEHIAELYKQRWQIELFFKWIKQNLKIRHVLATSENGVRAQLFVALISYILLRMAQATQKTVKQPLAFARLVRLNIMHKRPINTLSKPLEPPQNDPRQICMKLNPA